MSDPRPTSPAAGLPLAEPLARQAKHAAWWLLAYVASWPKFGVSELIGFVGGLVLIAGVLRGRIVLSRGQWLLSATVFLTYWLPELISAPDALERSEAWREVALDLRYAPFIALVVLAMATAASRRMIAVGAALIAAVWTFDALVQAATGWSLGGMATADRLSGIFGAGNLKLGWVLVALGPFVLQTAARRNRWLWLMAATAISVVVLLAGARAAWLALGLVLAGSMLTVFGARRRVLAAAAAVGLIVLGAAYVGSDRFAQRIDRTAAVLSGDVNGLDTALSYRLPIWRVAGRMILAHPVNGIGVRGYRESYARFAAPDDHWLQGDNHGAFHAHQWLLEVLAETGVLGLLCWLCGLSILMRGWRRAAPAVRAQAWAPGLALVAVLFPVNTHLALYSSFWGGVVLALLALFAGALAASQTDAAS